jgi:hypothetical protein
MASSESNLHLETTPVTRTTGDKLKSAILLAIFDISTPAATYVAGEGFPHMVRDVATAAVGCLAVGVSIKAWRSYVA